MNIYFQEKVNIWQEIFLHGKKPQNKQSLQIKEFSLII